MGYAIGQNSKGDEIGYGVEAICVQDGCTAEINKGLSFTCGGMQGVEGTAGCGRHFCSDHLFVGRSGPQLCGGCADAAPALYPDEIEDEADDDKLEATIATMRRLRAEMDRRASVLRALPESEFPTYLTDDERAWLLRAYAHRRRRYYAQAALAVLIVAGTGVALRSWRAGR